MASAPNSQLPLFYQALTPLNSKEHGNFKAKSTDKAPWLAAQHAVPLTVEEFPAAQRHFPIIFSSGENPVPLALMGLNEGVNVFFDADGKMTTDCYVPAYARRYPFMLAKLQPNTDQLSLCFDPQSGLVGDFEEGVALFADEQPSPETQNILKFNENFEQAGQKTAAFMEELKKHDLLMDGEVSIGQDGGAPFIYRGFQMVNQEKLKEVRGDVLRTWNQNGLWTLLVAHLMSLDLMREIFSRQVAQGKGPKPQPANGAAPANA